MKTKNILIGVGVLAGLFLVTRIYKRLNKRTEEQLDALDKNLVLSKGSVGAEVVELQRVLKDDLGYDLGSSGDDKDGIDGIFGSLTEKALFEAKGVKEITLNNLQNE